MRGTCVAGRLVAPVLPLTLLLLTAGPAIAGSQAGPARDPAVEALARLQGESAEPIRTRIDAATGRLSLLRGRFAASPGDPESAARDFLAGHAALFGMQADLADLRLAGQVKDAGGVVVRFEQRHEGLPVFGGTALVGLDAGGAVIHVRSHYVPGLTLPVGPKILEVDAVQAAEEQIGSPFKELRGDRRLVVVEGGKGSPGHYLAWEVHGFSEDPLGDWHIFVDALTGKVVRSLNLLKTTGPPCVPCDPTAGFDCGTVFFHNPVDLLDDPSLRDTSNVDAAQVPCRLENLVSAVQLDGLYATTQITSGRVGPPYAYPRSVNQQAADEVNVYFHADRAKRYLNEIGFPGVMDFPIQIDAHDVTVGDNAYYDPATLELHFGEGGVDDAQDGDIVYHEYGHAIQDNQVPGYGAAYEGGAMGEGFGDYWAGGLLDTRWATVLGRECLASWDATYYNPYNGTLGSGCIRRLDNTWLYPRDMVFEVHDDGEIWSAALWGMRGTLGAAVADRLVIKSHTFLTEFAEMIDGADALLSADAALYGGAHSDAIHGALLARGFPRTGTPASSTGMSATAAFSCQSTHQYANFEYKECRITQPGASRLRFRFSRLETEPDYDWVYVSDADYSEVERLSGNPFAGGSGYSAAVRGDTIVARFKADPAIRAWGFAIDEVGYVPGAGWIPDGGNVPGTPLTAGHGPSGEITLSWEPSCLSGDGDYEVYEGVIGDFASHVPRLCSTGGSTTVTLAPSAGSAYYLVVPRNAASEGSYGRRSDGTERPQSVAPCLPQEIAGSCP